MKTWRLGFTSVSLVNEWQWWNSNVKLLHQTSCYYISLNTKDNTFSHLSVTSLSLRASKNTYTILFDPELISTDFIKNRTWHVKWGLQVSFLFHWPGQVIDWFTDWPQEKLAEGKGGSAGQTGKKKNQAFTLVSDGLWYFHSDGSFLITKGLCSFFIQCTTHFKLLFCFPLVCW